MHLNLSDRRKKCLWIEVKPSLHAQDYSAINSRINEKLNLLKIDVEYKCSNRKKKMMKFLKLIEKRI